MEVDCAVDFEELATALSDETKKQEERERWAARAAESRQQQRDRVQEEAAVGWAAQAEDEITKIMQNVLSDDDIEDDKQEGDKQEGDKSEDFELDGQIFDIEGMLSSSESEKEKLKEVDQAIQPN